MWKGGIFTKSHNKLDLSIDFGNSNVDFLDAHLHTGVQLDQVRNFSVQVDIGFQFLDSQFDAADVKLGDIEVDIWSCAGGCCAGTRCRCAGSTACAIASGGEGARSSQSGWRRSCCLS